MKIRKIWLALKEEEFKQDLINLPSPSSRCFKHTGIEVNKVDWVWEAIGNGGSMANSDTHASKGGRYSLAPAGGGYKKFQKPLCYFFRFSRELRVHFSSKI